MVSNPFRALLPQRVHFFLGGGFSFYNVISLVITGQLNGVKYDLNFTIYAQYDYAVAHTHTHTHSERGRERKRERERERERERKSSESFIMSSRSVRYR